MLELIGLITVVLGSIVGGAMGWRILRRARESSDAPERWMGRALLFICVGGYPMLLLGQVVASDLARFAAVSTGVLCGHVGVVCIFWFTYRVFRPDVAWLRYALGVPFAGLAITALGSIDAFWGARGSGEAMVRESQAFGLALNLLSNVAFAWTAAESLRYHSLLRRRARLGLADPLVANRMLLWGVWGLASLAINGVSLAAELRQVDPARDALSLAALTGLSVVVIVALWLAFLPPEAWVRRVRRSVPGAASAA